MAEFLATLLVPDRLSRLFVSRSEPGYPWVDAATSMCIAAALFSIALVILQIATKKKEIQFRWILFLAGAFFGFRGLTLLLAAWTFFHPLYRLDWEFRFISAVLGLVTAIALIYLLPVLHRIPSISDLEREIEDRRRAEEQARAKEERFRNFVDSVQDYAMYMLDANGVVESWNVGAERIKGYSANEIVGRHFSCFYTAEDVAHHKPEETLRIAAEAGGFEGEGWRVRKDGTRFWANVILRPVRDAAGRVNGFSKVTRDLTQSRLAESKYEAILEAAPDAILIVGRQGQILLANERVEELFGYARAELLDRSVDMLVPGRYRAGHGALRREFFDAPQNREMGAGRELSGVRKNGTEFDVEISLSPLETAEGRVTLAAIRNVTERKKAEMRFRALLESAPDAMVIVNAQGVIELANMQTEKIFGYTRMELIGESVDILVPARLGSAHAGHRMDFFASPKKREMGLGLDLMAVRKDGTQFPVEISLSPLDGPNGVSVTAAIRDVTERKAAAAHLAAKVDELRHSNEQLEQFAHIASHDLQEPLRMVASYTQLLAKRYKGQLDADADEFIGYAVDGTQRMKRLIEDLLLYSRAGKGLPPTRQFSSGEALEISLQNLRTAIGESHAEISSGPMPIVAGAESPLVQVLQNLIGNAIKYRGDRTPRIHISAAEEAGEWIFSVADNGIGIETKYFERIFQIFQRLHGREEYEGTGIGLAICQRILQQQGGRIWVESEPGQGSTFHFALPVR